MTGATGNVGRVLVERLAAADRPVRALTRDPQRAGLPAGAEVVRFGPDRPAALFAGATKLFPYIQAAGEQTPALSAAARAPGSGTSSCCPPGSSRTAPTRPTPSTSCTPPSSGRSATAAWRGRSCAPTPSPTG
ncbi:SDR family oxidoreductase [Streptomyces viridochromogenes]|uniref:SDR family oxidoreductase n=1 Tax=Streptomyces viridochromogenes TaxID=1938 RepID=UPI001F2E1034|nr:NAD(P)H-binding protein [Streptomyces viridochromogenes]